MHAMGVGVGDQVCISAISCDNMHDQRHREHQCINWNFLSTFHFLHIYLEESRSNMCQVASRIPNSSTERDVQLSLARETWWQDMTVKRCRSRHLIPFFSRKELWTKISRQVWVAMGCHISSSTVFSSLTQWHQPLTIWISGSEGLRRALERPWSWNPMDPMDPYGPDGLSCCEKPKKA